VRVGGPVGGIGEFGKFGEIDEIDIIRPFFVGSRPRSWK